MKKIYYIFLLFLPYHLAAQSLSIEQLWDRMNNSSTYKQDSLLIGIQREELKELRNNRIPVFYIDANLQRNLIIPTTPVPAIAFDPDAREGAVIPLKFATKWSSKAGVQMEWNIFDPKRKSQEKEKELTLEKSELKQSEQAQQWKIDAVLAYTAVVLSSEQYKLAQQDSAAYEDILAVSKNRYVAGRESLSNHIVAEQEYERKQIQLREAYSVLIDADLELRRYTSLVGIKTLSSDVKQILEHVQKLQKTNFTVQSLTIDQKIVGLSQQDIKRQLLPTLSMNAYLGKQYFSNELKLHRSEEWYGNSFVNLALRVPLSSFLTAQPTFRKASLNASLIREQIQDVLNNERIDVLIQHEKVKNMEQKLHRLERIQTLAFTHRAELENAFRAGRILVTVFNESVVSHNKAVQDVWQAKYDLIKLLAERP